MGSPRAAGGGSTRGHHRLHPKSQRPKRDPPVPPGTAEGPCPLPSPAGAGNWGLAHLGQNSAPRIQVSPRSPPGMPQTLPEPLPAPQSPPGTKTALGTALAIVPRTRSRDSPLGVPLLAPGSAHPRGLQGPPKAPQEPLGGCRPPEIAHHSIPRGSHHGLGTKVGLGRCWGTLGGTGAPWGDPKGRGRARGGSGPRRAPGPHLRPLHWKGSHCSLQRAQGTSLGCHLSQ